MMRDVALPIIIGGTLTIVLAPFFAFVGSFLADGKGRSKAAWLVLCGLFFPTLILRFLLPRRKRPVFGEIALGSKMSLRKPPVLDTIMTIER